MSRYTREAVEHACRRPQQHAGFATGRAAFLAGEFARVQCEGAAKPRQRYVRERPSVTVRRLVAAGSVAVSRLSEVEVPAAIYRLVRERRLSVRSGDRAIAACLTDFAAWHVVEITVEVASLARTLLHRHDLRAGDAIQLASAVWLRQTVAVSGVLAFDTRLVAAAHAEQLAMPLLPRTKRASARAPRRSSAKRP